jgi:hypothetical protein
MLRSLYERLTTRLTQKEAVLESLYAEEAKYESVSSFELNTGEASQRVTRRRLDEVRKEIRGLEAEIDQLYRRINGTNAIRHVIQRNA